MADAQDTPPTTTASVTVVGQNRRLSQRLFWQVFAPWTGH